MAGRGTCGASTLSLATPCNLPAGVSRFREPGRLATAPCARVLPNDTDTAHEVEVCRHVQSCNNDEYTAHENKTWSVGAWDVVHAEMCEDCDSGE